MINFKCVEECLADILYDIDLYNDYVSAIMLDKTKILYQLLENGFDIEKKIVCEKLLNIVPDENAYSKIWFYSFAISMTKDGELLGELLEFILQSNKLKKNTLYFLHYQIRLLMFRSKELNTEKNICLLWKLMQLLLDKFKDEIDFEWKCLKYDERDSSLAVVIVEQFLAVQHGPTKTALDRCSVLMHKMGKRVILINTAELLSQVGYIPFWGALKGNYIENLKECDCQKWKGCEIPYVQCENNMPDLRTVEYLIRTIYDLKPEIVVSVGGGSLVSGLVNEIIPTLVVATTTSGVTPTLSDFQIVPMKMSKCDNNILKVMGKEEKFPIPGKFTFSLKEQTEHVTRKELGLPDKKFLLCVVGTRLDVEISENFIEMLEGILGEELGVIFIGKFDNYLKICEKHPILREYSYNLGMCDDILSRLELCDLYINPERRGGGTSCVEAMYKKLPVVALDYGDVAGIVGEDFICKNYKEMSDIILKYTTDKEFYNRKSQAAEKIAAEYLDSETEFERCVKIYIERMKNLKK